MSQWGAVKAKRLLAALLRIGWTIKREAGSHRTLAREGWPDVVFASMTPTRSARAWLRVSQSTLGCDPRIFSRLPNRFAADGGAMVRAEARFARVHRAILFDPPQLKPIRLGSPN